MMLHWRSIIGVMKSYIPSIRCQDIIAIGVRKDIFWTMWRRIHFAVAALRAVCIPARQVYTPRWAHTDDNHAWVEVWIDGKWHFLGACEPEPELDVAWFNAPASRGMLMNANALGCYDGPEEVLDAGRLYTQINVTENYTLTDTARVRVIDIHSNPVSGATVMFMLYNYGEFFPIAKKSRTIKDVPALHLEGETLWYGLRMEQNSDLPRQLLALMERYI